MLRLAFPSLTGEHVSVNSQHEIETTREKSHGTSTTEASDEPTRRSGDFADSDFAQESKCELRSMSKYLRFKVVVARSLAQEKFGRSGRRY